MNPPRPGNPAHPSSPLILCQHPPLAIATIPNPCLDLHFQFFIVLLVILLAELILLILFFVYMDKVSLQGEQCGRSHSPGDGPGQGRHGCRACPVLCRRPEGPALATSPPHLETLLVWAGEESLVSATLWCRP